jgi:hypothetical protein
MTKHNVAGEDYNQVDNHGRARARCASNPLGDNWTSPGLHDPAPRGPGNFAMDPQMGDLKIRKFSGELLSTASTRRADRAGQVGNFDITYAWAQMDRTIETASPTTATYSFWYDALLPEYYTSQGLRELLRRAVHRRPGNFINPSQLIFGHDGTTRSARAAHRLAAREPRRFLARCASGSSRTTRSCRTTASPA